MKTPFDAPPPVSVLSDDETKMLAEMVAPGAETAVEVSPDRPSDVLRALNIVVRATGELERRRGSLIMIVGKILHLIRNHPSIYTDHGYVSFDQFLKRHVVEQLGMSNSSLRDAIRIYEAFPTVSPKDVGEVGVTKMLLLSRVTNSTQPGHRKLVEAAKTQTYGRLLQVAAEKANLPPQEVLRALVAIPCTKAQARLWRQFIADPRVVAHCQTEDPGLILEYLIAEAMGEWVSEDAQDDSARIC